MSPRHAALPTADVPILKAVSEWRCSAENHKVYLRLQDGTRGSEEVHWYEMWADDKQVARFDLEQFEDAKSKAVDLLLALVGVDRMRRDADEAYEQVMNQYDHTTAGGVQ